MNSSKILKAKSVKTKDVVLVTDQDYLPILLQLIESAKTRIDIMAFSFAIGSAKGRMNDQSAPFQIAQALISAKEKLGRKLKIRIYMEGARDTSERNRVTAQFLEPHGIEIVFGATHAKGVCIDRKYLLIGSTNWSNQSILKNFETNLLIKDLGVSKQFIMYLDYMWEGGSHGGIRLNPPMYADGDFMPLLLDLIAQAKKTIHFSIYFFNHKAIEAALVAASHRGVAVHGLIHDHKSFALPYIWANHATVKRMLKSGIEDLTFGSPTLFSHSKYLVIDQKQIALGTGNWLTEDVKTHPQLYLSFTDSSVARGLIKHLKQQIEYTAGIKLARNFV